MSRRNAEKTQKIIALKNLRPELSNAEIAHFLGSTKNSVSYALSRNIGQLDEEARDHPPQELEQPQAPGSGEEARANGCG
jgi:hypothetical protein